MIIERKAQKIFFCKIYMLLSFKWTQGKVHKVYLRTGNPFPKKIELNLFI